MADTKKKQAETAKAKAPAKKSARLTKEEKEEIRRKTAELEAKMAKKKRLHDEIWAVVIIAIGVFLLLSLLTQTTGAVGRFIGSVLFGVFGRIAYGIPFYLILLGILIVANKTAFLGWRMILCAVLLVLFAASINAKLVADLTAPITLKGIPGAYALGKEGPGVVGYLLGGLLFKAIGEVGLYIVCIVGIIVMLLFIIDTPISVFFDNFKLRRQAAQQAKAEHRIEREKQIEFEQYIKEETLEARRENHAGVVIPAPETKPQPVSQDTKPLPAFTGVKEAYGGFTSQNDAAGRVEEPAVVEEEELPQHEYRPEDIGLTSSNNPEENRSRILGYMTDDELFGVSSSQREGYGLDGSDSRTPGYGLEPAEGEVMPEGTAPETVQGEPAQPAEGGAPKPAAKKPLPRYKFPPLNLLHKPSGSKVGGTADLAETARVLEQTLASFDVNAKVTDYVRGPAVTRFEVQPATGVKVSRIVNLKDDLALNLRAKSLRIEAPIPGKAAVGIEVSNERVQSVLLRELLESQDFKNAKSKISVGLGKNISGQNIIANLKDMPHLLIAGATGSGKSVCINSIIMSLLYKATPDEVKLILIDPKVVELSVYNGIPHLLIPVVTDPPKAAAALGWAVTEMDERYNKFQEEGVRDLESYNEKARADGEEDKLMPQVVIIIDELADLMLAARNQVETYISRLAAKARAAGMHLILATQRPSVDVITGVIKANIPSRIAFAVSSHIDSRTILDVGGAETLVGKGDMLYAPQGASVPMRVQGCFVSDDEVKEVIEYVKKTSAEVEYAPDVVQALDRTGMTAAEKEEDDQSDELLTDAVEAVIRAGQASVSMLQRRFRIGYNRSARLIDMMEERGIVGPPDGARPRKVLMTIEQFEQLQEASLEAENGELS